MQSAIILGTIDKTREKTKEIIKQNSVSKFDTEIFSSQKAIGIADIRSLQKKIFLKPAYSEKKVVILESFYGATVDAQNAFLKILEEPPPNTIILVLATNLDFVLPTVLSRCSLINIFERKKLEKLEEEKYLELLVFLIKGEENPLVIAQDYGRTKEDALELLENMIIATHTSLANNTRLGKTIKKIQQTHTIIKTTNVNVRFALENLFLNLN